MSDLPEYSQQRVRQTIPARDLYDAQQIVKNLERDGSTGLADDCPAPSPTVTGPTASPGTTGPDASAEAQPPVSPAPAPAVCEEGK